MKNTTLFLGALVLIVFIGGFVFVKSGSSADSGSTATITNSEAQKITLSMRNYNYYPDTIRVKEGQKVDINLDESVRGCLRSFTIPEMGVAKVARTPQDTISFVPNRKGSFTFACSMGMGYGTLVVE